MYEIRHRRLLNDLKDITRNYPQFRASYSDISHWTVAFAYSQRRIELEIEFPDGYPQDPPKCRFSRPIFHPNVWIDGRICLDVISSHWVSAMSAASVVLTIIALLEEPNPDSPANIDASYLCKTDACEYSRRFSQQFSEFPFFDSQ